MQFRIEGLLSLQSLALSYTEELEMGSINLFLYYIFRNSLGLMIESILDCRAVR